MNLILKTSCLVVVTAALTGCFNGSSNKGSDNGPKAAVDFTRFVKAEIDNTDDTREAVQINDQEFSFNDQNNEQAFDNLFMQ